MLQFLIFSLEEEPQDKLNNFFLQAIIQQLHKGNSCADGIHTIFEINQFSLLPLT